MRTAVPVNSRRNVQRTRRAAKTSVGMMSTETAFRYVQPFRAAASSTGILVCSSKCFDGGFRNTQSYEYLSVVLGMLLASRCRHGPSSALESRTFFTRPFA